MARRHSPLPGLLAILAATAQAIWLPDASNHISAYLIIWISTAVERACRCKPVLAEFIPALSNEMIRMAVEQFTRHDRPDARGTRDHVSMCGLDDGLAADSSSAAAWHKGVARKSGICHRHQPCVAPVGDSNHVA